MSAPQPRTVLKVTFLLAPFSDLFQVSQLSLQGLFILLSSVLVLLYLGLYFVTEGGYLCEFFIQFQLCLFQFFFKHLASY